MSEPTLRQDPPAAPQQISARALLEVAAAFSRLGCLSFGGPIAHLGYLRAEFVERRAWLDDARYGDLVALCQFLPGPASSQVVFALGMLRAGLLGAIVASLCFTLPSALLMIAFAYGAARGATAGLLHSGAEKLTLLRSACVALARAAAVLAIIYAPAGVLTAVNLAWPLLLLLLDPFFGRPLPREARAPLGVAFLGLLILGSGEALRGPMGARALWGIGLYVIVALSTALARQLEERLVALRDILRKHPGGVQTALSVRKAGRWRQDVQLPSHFRVVPSDELLQSLETLLGEGCVRLS